MCSCVCPFKHRRSIFVSRRVCRTRDIRFAVVVVARERCHVALSYDLSSCATLGRTRVARLTLGCSMLLIQPVVPDVRANARNRVRIKRRCGETKHCIVSRGLMRGLECQ